MFSRTIFFSRRSRRVSKERPKTATLPHPQVLDETLKDKVAILDLVAGIRAQRVLDHRLLPGVIFLHDLTRFSFENHLVAGNPKYGIT